MNQFNEKVQSILTIVEIFLLFILIVLVACFGFKYIDIPISNYLYFAIMAFLAGILAARLVLDRNFKQACEITSVNQNEELEELKQSYSLLQQERNDLDKELKAFKINHEKISNKVAELFTLQVVSDTINSTLELDRLLNTINDIIVGIMGVNTCTICIFEENQGGVRYLVTNEKREYLQGSIRNMALNYLEGEQMLSQKIIVQEVTGFEPVTRISFAPVIKNRCLIGTIITGHTEDNLFDGEDVRFLEIICNQISMAIENAKLYEKVNNMANTDFLTGLYNRTYFFSRFGSILENIGEDQLLAVSMFDIDNFKLVNDRYGHDFGDVVLIGMARVIKNMIRKDDIFVRYGGEEFILILQDITTEKANERLNQIREAIQESVFQHNDLSLSITVSVGVAYFTKNNDAQDVIIKKADMALYRAKKNGKNRIEVFEGEITQ